MLFFQVTVSAPTFRSKLILVYGRMWSNDVLDELAAISGGR